MSNFGGWYVRSLSAYSRCRLGVQIVETNVGTSYEGDMSYAGPRLNSAGHILVDETVRIARSPGEMAREFHRSDDPDEPVFGNDRVHIDFAAMLASMSAPVAVKVKAISNTLGGTTFLVSKLEGQTLKSLRAEPLKEA